MNTLQRLIESFPQRGRCERGGLEITGDCESVSLAFCKLARRNGLRTHVICFGTPRRDPDEPGCYGIFYRNPDHDQGCRECISHYASYFPDEQLIIDWTARQFWQKAPCPMVLNHEQFAELWSDGNFANIEGESDSRTWSRTPTT